MPPENLAHPYAFVATTWSDDQTTIDGPFEKWFADWILASYGDKDFWTNQIRPVHAHLSSMYYLPQAVYGVALC